MDHAAVLQPKLEGVLSPEHVHTNITKHGIAACREIFVDANSTDVNQINFTRTFSPSDLIDKTVLLHLPIVAKYRVATGFNADQLACVLPGSGRIGFAEDGLNRAISHTTLTLNNGTVTSQPKLSELPRTYYEDELYNDLNNGLKQPAASSSPYISRTGNGSYAVDIYGRNFSIDSFKATVIGISDSASVDVGQMGGGGATGSDSLTADHILNSGEWLKNPTEKIDYSAVMNATSDDSSSWNKLTDLCVKQVGKVARQLVPSANVVKTVAVQYDIYAPISHDLLSSEFESDALTNIRYLDLKMTMPAPSLMFKNSIFNTPHVNGCQYIGFRARLFRGLRNSPDSSTDSRDRYGENMDSDALIPIVEAFGKAHTGNDAGANVQAHSNGQKWSFQWRGKVYSIVPYAAQTSWSAPADTTVSSIVEKMNAAVANDTHGEPFFKLYRSSSSDIGNMGAYLIGVHSMGEGDGLVVDTTTGFSDGTTVADGLGALSHVHDQDGATFQLAGQIVPQTFSDMPDVVTRRVALTGTDSVQSDSMLFAKRDSAGLSKLKFAFPVPDKVDWQYKEKPKLLMRLYQSAVPVPRTLTFPITTDIVRQTKGVMVGGTVQMQTDSYSLSEVPNAIYIYAVADKTDWSSVSTDNQMQAMSHPTHLLNISKVNFRTTANTGTLSAADQRQLFQMCQRNGYIGSFRQFSEDGNVMMLKPSSDLGGWVEGARETFTHDFEVTVRLPTVSLDRLPPTKVKASTGSGLAVMAIPDTSTVKANGENVAEMKFAAAPNANATGMCVNPDMGDSKVFTDARKYTYSRGYGDSVSLYVVYEMVGQCMLQADGQMLTTSGIDTTEVVATLQGEGMTHTGALPSHSGAIGGSVPSRKKHLCSGPGSSYGGHKGPRHSGAKTAMLGR